MRTKVLACRDALKALILLEFGRSQLYKTFIYTHSLIYLYTSIYITNGSIYRQVCNIVVSDTTILHTRLYILTLGIYIEVYKYIKE